MRGKLGAVEVRGAELIAAAEAHDALFSFDSRARAAALEVGLPLLPDGEILFVNLDPRAVLDVESSLRTTWPVVDAPRRRPVADLPRADPPRALPRPRRCSRRSSTRTASAARWSRSTTSPAAPSRSPASRSCKPDIAKIDRAMTAGIQHSPARRRLVAALVEVAHELDCRVVAEGIERVDEFEAMRELGVDLGQGFYFGQPTAKPMAVDPRLVRKRAELV